MKFLFRTTGEPEAARSEGKAKHPTRGLKEDRDKIDVADLIADPGRRDEEAQIADAEDGTEPA